MAEGETWDIFKACPISHWCRFGFLVIQWPLLWYVTSRVTPLSENEILHTPCHHHLLTTLQDAGEHQSSEFFPISPPKYLPSTAVAKSWERHKTIPTKSTASVFRMAIRIYYRMLLRAIRWIAKSIFAMKMNLTPPQKHISTEFVKKTSGCPRRSSKCQDRLLELIQLRDRGAPPVQSLLKNGSRQVWGHLHAQRGEDFWRMVWCQEGQQWSHFSPGKYQGQCDIL